MKSYIQIKCQEAVVMVKEKKNRSDERMKKALAAVFGSMVLALILLI